MIDEVLFNMKFENVYFVSGTAYAGKSTIVKALANKHDGIACEENYHDTLIADFLTDRIRHWTISKSA